MLYFWGGGEGGAVGGVAGVGDGLVVVHLAAAARSPVIAVGGAPSLLLRLGKVSTGLGRWSCT